MPIHPRAHPRFRVELSASIEVRQSSSGGVRLGSETTTRTSLEAALRDVSAGGLSFVVKKGPALEKGCAVTVKLVIAGRTVSLPGSVVWSQTADAGSLSGVRVHTELTDSLTRTAFGRWLASRR
jgi:hypothetical protein